MDNTYKAIDQYLLLDISEKEQSAILDFKSTVMEYEKNFQKAISTVGKSINPADIDIEVKVDDTKAFLISHKAPLLF